MNIACHHCKSTIQIPMIGGRSSIAFRETCPSCASDLHICRNCNLYDSGAHHECRESSAEWVKDKERANRCEYFSAKSENTEDRNAKTTAKSALDDLFK